MAAGAPETAAEAVWEFLHPRCDSLAGDTSLVDDMLKVAGDSELGEERLVRVADVVAWLRHVDRLDEVPGARAVLPGCNPLWDVAGLLAHADLSKSARD